MTVSPYPCTASGALVSFKPALSPQEKRYIDIAYNILKHMRKEHPKISGERAGLLSVLFGATPITMVLICIISDSRGKITPKFDYDLKHYLKICDQVWDYRYYFQRNPKTGHQEPVWKSVSMEVMVKNRKVDLIAYVNQKYPKAKLFWASMQAIKVRSIVPNMLQCEYYNYKTPEWYAKANANRRKRRTPLGARVSAPIRNKHNPYVKSSKR